MEVDCLAFFQDRMSRAYEEQIWAVALVAGMNAFIANQAGQLLETFKCRITVVGVSFTSILAILFGGTNILTKHASAAWVWHSFEGIRFNSFD